MEYYKESQIDHVDERSDIPEYFVKSFFEDCENIQFTNQYESTSQAINDYFRENNIKSSHDDSIHAILYTVENESTVEETPICIDTSTRDFFVLDDTMLESFLDDEFQRLKVMKNTGMISEEEYKKQQDMLFKRQRNYEKNIKKEKEEKPEEKNIFKKLKEKMGHGNPKVVTESMLEDLVIFESDQKSDIDNNFKKKSSKAIKSKAFDLGSSEGKKYIKKDKYLSKLDCTKYNGEIIVDLDKDKIIGRFLVMTGKDEGFIGSLRVYDDYKGYGFGDQLIKDAIRKYNGIDLMVYKDNKVAFKLYKKCGFVIIREFDDTYYMKLKSKLTKDEKPISESVDLSHDWTYIMETTKDESDIFLEAASDSTLLRDFIYPFIENTFKNNPANVRKFNQLVSNYINRNIDKLTTSGPVYLIPFTDNDKAQYYTLFGITEKELKKTMKEHTRTLGSSKFLLLNQNPIFSLFYFVIRYFTLHPDKKNLNSALSIYALSAYPSIYTKYFPNGVIEPVMKYTIDNMTDKFLIKKTNHVFGALVESIQNSYRFLKPYMKEASDKEVIRFIQRIRNDHNSMFKKIANVYMDNYKKGNAVVTTNTMYDDDTPIVDEIANASTEVQNAVLKVSMPIISNGVDIVRAEASAKMSGIGVSDCRYFLTQIMTEKNVNELQMIIESILFLYIYEEKKRVRDIRSEYFLAWAASLFKKTNSKNDNVTRINTILNKWAEESGINKKYARIASRINYKKSIFFYIILSIQKYIA